MRVNHGNSFQINLMSKISNLKHCMTCSLAAHLSSVCLADLNNASVGQSVISQSVFCYFVLVIV